MTSLILGQIIKKAILSEKTYKQMESRLYTFLVDRRATKQEVAKSVEKQFDVKVLTVNVLKKFSKTKRVSGTRKWTKVTGGKKAAVYLAPGQKIEMLAPTEKKELKSKRDKESKDKKEKKGLLSRIKK